MTTEQLQEPVAEAFHNGIDLTIRPRHRRERGAAMSTKDDHPQVKFCPFCGAQEIKIARGPVPRCMKCRAVFFVNFSRYMRAAMASTQEEQKDVL